MLHHIDRPLAYHITFGTYGTRLHGDERGTVDRSQNKPGDPIIGRDNQWFHYERSALKYAPVVLSLEERIAAEAALAPVCNRGGWTLHSAASQPDHVHVLLSAAADGGDVRPWLKRWLGESLQKTHPLTPHRTRWCEGGSVRWVWTRDYFENVAQYILEQRTTPG